jgi:hypothetical protein
MTAFAERAAEEVGHLHDLFVEMFTGRAGEGALRECLSRFARAFVRVAPDGTVQDLAALEGMLARASAAADFAIAIELEAAEPVGESGAVVRYIERQSGAGRESARRSTAVFVPGANGAPVWLALHETWIAQ